MALNRKLSSKLYAQIEEEIINTKLPDNRKISKAKAKAMAKVVADLTADLDADYKTQVDPYIAQIKSL